MSSGRRALSRREFLAGAAAAVPYVLTSAARGAPSGRSSRRAEGAAPTPTEKIGVGFIGFGRRGYELGSLLARMPQVQCVVACDVDSRRTDYAMQYIGRRQAGMKTCKDFRKVLDNADVDAVFVATPDHWHAIGAIEAVKAGKDVFCESPLSLTVGEARAMAAAARRYGRVFQTGTHRRSLSLYREACELVQDGRLGEIKTVHVLAGTTSGHCFLGGAQVPSTLDWDMWLGPAPEASYHPYRCISTSGSSSYGWRLWRDYSGGQMTSYGAHYFDVVQWALGADGTGPVEIIPPDGKEHKVLTYRYANGVTMYNDKGPKGAAIEFTGTEGVLGIGGAVTSRTGYQTWPEALATPSADRGRSRSASRYYSSNDHLGNFLECIKTREKCVSDVAIACRSVTISHLGNIAYWLNRALKWDPVKEEIVGDPEASRWLDRPRRAPWRL